MIKHKKDLIKNVLISVAAPVIILIVWQAASNAGLINKAILPSVTSVVDTGISLIEKGRLQEHILISIIRVVQGFLLGTVLGTVIGVIMAFSKFTNRFLGSLVGILRPVPMIAWVPLLILWLGIGEETKISLITVGTFWPVLLNTIHGIQSVDTKLLEVAKILKKNRFTIIFKVIFPAALPSMLTGIRLGMGNAWSCVVTAEMIAASKGIGYMITYARDTSKPAEVLVGVFVIGLIGLLIDTVILRLQKRFLRWN